MSNLDAFNKEYILSDGYIQDMLNHFPGTYEDFLNFKFDAEPKSDNYNFRHFALTKQLGGWRWKPLLEYREYFAGLIFSDTLKGVDFGGSQRPISSHLDIVDIEDTDFYGRPVKYKALSEIEYDLDFIFSSHTLEHIPNLEEILKQFYDNLTEDGIVALNLPSYSCKRWWADTGNWMGGTPHVHTFKLSKTEITEDIPKLIDIDIALEKAGFKVPIAEYSGDNTIVIFAEK